MIENQKYELLQGDCLERMKEIEDGSVDMVMCDLPYGTTACRWDARIPFAPLWAEYRRVCKPSAAIVLTASQPFTSALIMSNPDMFKYCWVWEKNRGTGFLDSKKRPLKFHEDIAVFCQSQPTYNPVRWAGAKNNATLPKGETRRSRVKSEIYHGDSDNVQVDLTGMKYPRSILKFDGIPPSEGRLHPTQKPVSLMEYLIKTYTDEGQVVMDNCVGSGSTGVACANTNRRFIGIERDEGYFAIAKKRVEEVYALRAASAPVEPAATPVVTSIL